MYISNYINSEVTSIKHWTKEGFYRWLVFFFLKLIVIAILVKGYKDGCNV